MPVFHDVIAAGVVDSSGSALSSGQVYFYAIGTTSKVDIFSDPELTVPLSNPVTLDAAGKAKVYTERAVRMVIQSSAGVTVADYDEVGSLSTEDVSVATSVSSEQIPPVGAIIAHYDFDDDLSFDDDRWVYCDGGSYTIGAKVRQTPDLSNRYLVGFGTEGGGDIDTAAWSTTVVGNSGHEVDISHTHSVTTTLGTDVLQTSVAPTYTQDIAKYSGSPGGAGLARVTTAGGASSVLYASFNASGTAASGGSSTQDIQPRSISVRFIMRAS